MDKNIYFNCIDAIKFSTSRIRKRDNLTRKTDILFHKDKTSLSVFLNFSSERYVTAKKNFSQVILTRKWKKGK